MGFLALLLICIFWPWVALFAAVCWGIVVGIAALQTLFRK